MAMEVKINPKMLILARESRGKSQKDIADFLATVPHFISMVESGNRTLSEETVAKLSKHLKYPADFFYQTGEAYVPMSLNYRKRDHVAAKVLVPLEARINIYRIHIEIICSKVKPKELNLPVLDLKKYESEEQVAKYLRKFWKLPKGPIENLAQVLEDNGILVLSFDFDTERVDSRTIFTKTGLPIICINRSHRADRQRFSLAYELGHMVMHAHTQPSFERDISHEANMFAASLLMPQSEIAADLSLPKGISIPLLGDLKRKWKVSMQSLLFRAADLGLLTDNQKRYLLQQFNQLKIRRREPPELDFPSEKPKLLRDIMTKYKSAHKYSVKEMAAMLHLELEEFMSRYGE